MALAPIVSGITPVLGDALLVGQRWWPPTGFEPVFGHGHVFASSSAPFSLEHPEDT
jgi:hypothetical protein